MLRRIFNSIKYRIKHLLYEDKVLVSLGDYLYLRDGHSIKMYHVIIGSRILDIEHWKKTGEPLFENTNAISKVLYNAMNIKHDSKSDDVRFLSLLESFGKNGFDPSSRIGIAKNFTVNDGTHRAALAFCYNINQLPGYYTMAPPYWDTKIPAYLEEDESCHTILEFIKERILKAQNELKENGVLLTCVVPCNSNYSLDRVMEDLEKECTIVGTTRNDKEDRTLIVLLPRIFDYYVKGGKLGFKSITNLGKKLKKKYGDVDLTDNFIDGKMVYDRFMK